MPRGFFSRFAAVGAGRAPLPLVARCGACGLYKKCLSPKMLVYGEGRKGILVIGEAPGKDEDKEGRPFVGRTGQMLRDELRRLDVDLDRDCWATNALICRPPGNRIDNPKAVEYCRPNVVRALKELQPEKVLLFGAQAVRSVIGWLWREDPGGVERWVGWRIPSRRLSAWVCPAWHPSHVLRQESEGDRGEVRGLFRKHLAAALELERRPDPIPEPRVEILLDPERAAAKVNGFEERGLPVAFDYETDRLKCDPRDASVYSCAVSDGERTIAYPWQGRAIGATRSLLWSRVPKIGYNMKFEERWTRKEFGDGVGKNWQWCGMTAAHVLDNRRGVVGLKFQAFVLLGFEPWDGRGVGDKLKAPTANARNKIHEAPIREVLRYNGYDAYLEWHVAQVQMKQMGRGRVPGGQLL